MAVKRWFLVVDLYVRITNEYVLFPQILSTGDVCLSPPGLTLWTFTAASSSERTWFLLLTFDYFFSGFLFMR